MTSKRRQSNRCEVPFRRKSDKVRLTFTRIGLFAGPLGLILLTGGSMPLSAQGAPIVIDRSTMLPIGIVIGLLIASVTATIKVVRMFDRAVQGLSDQDALATAQRDLQERVRILEQHEEERS